MNFYLERSLFFLQSSLVFAVINNKFVEPCTCPKLNLIACFNHLCSMLLKSVFVYLSARC